MNQSQEVNGKNEGSNLDMNMSTAQLKDIIDLNFLQRLQDNFAKGVSLASVTVKLKGVTNTLNDGLGLISTTMEQLATSAGDISKRQTDLNHEIVCVNAVTDKIDSVMSFIREIGNETRLLGVNAAAEAAKAIKAANAIEVAKAIEAAKALEAANAIKAANELAAAKAIEAALAIAAARAITNALAIAKAKAAESAKALEAANALAAAKAIEAAKTIETTNANPVVKAVEAGLGLLILGVGLGVGLGVVAPEIRKHLTGSKEAVTMGSETPSTIEQQAAAREQVTTSVGQGDLLGRRYRLSGQGNFGRRLFQR